MVSVIKASVIEYFDITPNLLLSSSRKHPLPEARRFITFLLVLNGCKPNEIAKEINRNHCNVSRSVNIIATEMLLYKDVRTKFAKIKIIIMEKLTNQKLQLEKWLRENPDTEWVHRYDKIKELAEINKQITELETN